MDKNNNVDKSLRDLIGKFIESEATLKAIREFLKENRDELDKAFDEALEENFKSLGNAKICKEICKTIKENPGIGFNELCRKIEEKRLASRVTIGKYLSLLKQLRIIEERKEGRKLALYPTNYQSKFWEKLMYVIYLASLGQCAFDVLKYEKKNNIRNEEDIKKEAIQFFKEFKKFYIRKVIEVLKDLNDTDKKILEYIGLNYLRGLEFSLLLEGWTEKDELSYEFIVFKISEYISKAQKYNIKPSVPYYISRR